ncbi:MAG: hypothetical protein ACTSX7_07215, partial [Alphaproteobacteria bacterium]
TVSMVVALGVPWVPIGLMWRYRRWEVPPPSFWKWELMIVHIDKYFTVEARKYRIATYIIALFGAALFTFSLQPCH